MLVYLATYPRAGNAYLQRLFRRSFHMLSSQASGPTSLDAWQAALDADEPGWALRDIDGRIISYRWRDGPERRMLLPGSIEQLTGDLRTSLSRDPEIFLYKKHSLPFDRYLADERVIQLHRHPGAALWSYFRYLIDFRYSKLTPQLLQEAAPTIDNVICGKALFGDWSDYHTRWQAAGERLGRRYLNLGYEDLVAEPERGVERLSAFLGLPIASRDRVDFDAYRRRFPGKDLRGTSAGYEAFYTARQLRLLWERHGSVAQKFGYEPPDFGAAQPDEQVRRLEALLEAVWPRAREAGSTVG